MAAHFQTPRIAIDDAIRQMKENGIVHPDAEFNSEAQDGLRAALEMLQKLYDRLMPRAWVIAHDNVDWAFSEHRI